MPRPDAAITDDRDRLVFERREICDQVGAIPICRRPFALEQQHLAEQREQHRHRVLGDDRRPDRAGIGDHNVGRDTVV
jgi:hypothetical protein